MGKFRNFISIQFYLLRRILQFRIEFQANESIIEKHYAHHYGKDFFPMIAEYMTSGPVVPMIWEGIDAIQVGRQMIAGDKS